MVYGDWSACASRQPMRTTPTLPMEDLLNLTPQHLHIQREAILATYCLTQNQTFITRMQEKKSSEVD